MDFNNNNEISLGYESLFSLTPSDSVKVDALVLAAQFLDIINKNIENRKITRKQLALQMGTSGSWLTQLFRGDKLPSLETIIQMAKILDISFEIRDTSEDVVTKPLEQVELMDNMRKIEHKRSPKWIIQKPDWETVGNQDDLKNTEKVKYSLPMSA